VEATDEVLLGGSCANATPAVSKRAATASSTTGSRRIAATAGLVAQRLLRDRGIAPLPAPRRGTMLETIAVILIILWLLGMVSGYTLGNFIYVLLVIAIVLFLVRLISGRRV
jgi:uncharacterized membrane protein YjdF